jgi:predicted RNase H-like HicB family nuclease
MTPRYHINLSWSDEDSAWVARVPDLPGCSAWGETPEAASREVAIAMQLWLDVAREDGRDIPLPRYAPDAAAARDAA